MAKSVDTGTQDPPPRTSYRRKLDIPRCWMVWDSPRFNAAMWISEPPLPALCFSSISAQGGSWQQSTGSLPGRVTLGDIVGSAERSIESATRSFRTSSSNFMCDAKHCCQRTSLSRPRANIQPEGSASMPSPDDGEWRWEIGQGVDSKAPKALSLPPSFLLSLYRYSRQQVPNCARSRFPVWVGLPSPILER